MKIKLNIGPLIKKCGYYIIVLFSPFLLFQCQPKGPISFPSKFIGQNKSFLIESKGKPNTIKRFDDRTAFIYISKEEYFGNKKNIKNTSPKKIYNIEYIYYIDNNDIIYKYQVWKKREK